MQNIKDSFYVALRDRLAALDPARTVFLGGQVRPAILVRENEAPNDAPDAPGVFHLTWSEAQIEPATRSAQRPLLELTCAVDYFVEGSEGASYQDRGRMLDAMDTELLAITSLASAALQDFSTDPAADLGQKITWSRPKFDSMQAEGRRVSRTASIRVMAFAEADLT